MTDVYCVFKRLLSELDGTEKYSEIQQTSPKNRVAEYALPIPLVNLEMFEAELRNQGKLRREEGGILSLMQYAQREISLCRWRALRLGVNSKKLNFTVSLPRFLVAKADHVMAQLSKSKEQSGKRLSNLTDASEREILIRQLMYFAQIARFLLNDEFETGTEDHDNYSSTPPNSHMELLVRLLISSKSHHTSPNEQDDIRSEEQASSTRIIEIVLPASTDELIRRLK